ncbi:hypothetical protein GCM10022393_34870 [Aquimarina addita]|uniref:Anti-sigma factor n=1 Tax=Aquimarina addita TaxID=870485 RepID=A0ABP6URQ8_9FLAO
MDNFEKHITKNKHRFDTHKADRDKLWNGIESALDNDNKKTITFWRSPFLKVAASIVILIGSFFIISLLITSDLDDAQNNNIVNQELKDIDTYYNGLVAFQIQLVKNNTKLSTEDKTEFLSFMDELDEEYFLLRQEMKANLNNEYILEAIVNNYKKRIELIENLLKQINDSKKSENNEGYIL